jgi:hypothetical protein
MMVTDAPRCALPLVERNRLKDDPRSASLHFVYKAKDQSVVGIRSVAGGVGSMGFRSR